VAALAIGVDVLLSLLQTRLTPRALRTTRRRGMPGPSGPTSVVDGADLPEAAASPA
jgi:hypothetical protein